jgi:hypothetical protein
MSQGASNGGAQGAGNNRFVKFTRPAAQRIADAVRKVEGGNRDLGPVELWPRFAASSGKTFRVCTFTGAWSIGSAKTVTFRNQTATPNTALATNLFFPITNTATATRDCAIAKDGTAWYLIDVPMATATAVFVTGTATATVFGTASTSTLTFFSPANTAQLTFVTGVSASLNTTDCTISVTTATATATSISMGGTQTAISVSMSGTQTLTFLQTTVTATYLTFG